MQSVASVSLDGFKKEQGKRRKKQQTNDSNANKYV